MGWWGWGRGRSRGAKEDEGYQAEDAEEIRCSEPNRTDCRRITANWGYISNSRKYLSGLTSLHWLWHSWLTRLGCSNTDPSLTRGRGFESLTWLALLTSADAKGAGKSRNRLQSGPSKQAPQAGGGRARASSLGIERHTQKRLEMCVSDPRSFAAGRWTCDFERTEKREEGEQMVWGQWLAIGRGPA